MYCILISFTLDESMFGKGKFNRGDDVDVPISHVRISRVINERITAVQCPRRVSPINTDDAANMIAVISINLLLPRHVQSSVTRYRVWSVVQPSSQAPPVSSQ